MYINQPNVYIAYEELTEEQIKAVQQGYAYRRWKRRNVLTVVLTIVWICSGMFLMNIFPENSIMNNIIFVLYLNPLLMSIQKCVNFQTDSNFCNCKLFYVRYKFKIIFNIFATLSA